MRNKRPLSKNALVISGFLTGTAIAFFPLSWKMSRLRVLKSMPGWAATPPQAQGPDHNGLPEHADQAPRVGTGSISSAAKSKGSLPAGGCPLPPELTASHTGPARNELHHLCLYMDYASFSLMPPTPLQHRSQENLLILEAEAPALQSRWDKLPILLLAISQKHPSANTHNLPCVPVTFMGRCASHRDPLGRDLPLPLAQEASAQAL